MTSCFRDISVWSRRILLYFCWVSIFIDILINYISWTVAETPINHSILWKSVMRPFRCIYINCFNRLRFLLRSARCKKCTFLENLQTTTQEGNMETRQRTSFFSSAFSNLTVTSIFLFENGQNPFCCGPPFGSFWSLKYLTFWPKATNSDSPSIFFRK